MFNVKKCPLSAEQEHGSILQLAGLTGSRLQLFAQSLISHGILDKTLNVSLA